MKHLQSVVVCLLAIISACGCGNGLVDVTAKLTLDGKPLSNAQVTLSPISGGGQTAYGDSDESGMVPFFSTVGAGNGVMPGQYRVLVMKSPSSAPQEIPRFDPNDPEALKKFQKATSASIVAHTPTALPTAYLDPNRSPVSCEVDSETSELDLALTSNAGRR